MKKFLKDLEEELRKNNLNEEEIADIIADHREMIDSAINDGLTDAELEEKFGNPKDVAEELSQFSDKEEKGREKKKMKSKELNGIESNYNVNVGLINEDIVFKHADGDSILVEYTGKRDLEEYTITYENNEFVLHSPKRMEREIGMFGNQQRLFTVTLPNNKKINKFKLSEINGDIVVADIEAEEFEFNTKNGDVKFANMILDTFKISTINGDLEIDGCKAAMLTISQISGDMELKNSIIKHDIDINTVSGDLEFENVECVNFRLKSVSGDLDGKEFYPERVSLTSVSGDISIKNKDSARPIEIQHKKTVSGDVEIKYQK